MKRSLFAVLCAAVLVSCGADPKGRGESESANPHACIGNLYTKGLEHVSGMVSGAVGGYVSGGEYGAAVGSITAAANAGLSL